MHHTVEMKLADAVLTTSSRVRTAIAGDRNGYIVISSETSRDLRDVICMAAAFESDSCNTFIIRNAQVSLGTALKIISGDGGRFNSNSIENLLRTAERMALVKLTAAMEQNGLIKSNQDDMEEKV